MRRSRGDGRGAAPSSPSCCSPACPRRRRRLRRRGRARRGPAAPRRCADARAAPLPRPVARHHGIGIGAACSWSRRGASPGRARASPRRLRESDRAGHRRVHLRLGATCTRSGARRAAAARARGPAPPRAGAGGVSTLTTGTRPAAAAREPLAVRVPAAGRQLDPLDVVAVEVVDRAAQRAEPVAVLERGDPVEHRVGRRAALEPQAALRLRPLGLLRRELDRRGPGDRGAGQRGAPGRRDRGSRRAS